MPISCHVATTAATSRTSCHILRPYPFCPGPLTRSTVNCQRESPIYTYYSERCRRGPLSGWLGGWVAGRLGHATGTSLISRKTLHADTLVSAAGKRNTRRTCPCFSHPVSAPREKPTKLSCHSCHCPICLMNCQNDIHWRLTCNKRNEAKWNGPWHGMGLLFGKKNPKDAAVFFSERKYDFSDNFSHAQNDFIY